MAVVFRTDEAAWDLEDIWHYIARDSPRAADKFLRVLDRKCRIMAETPGIGRKRDEFSPGLRSHACGRYLIFFRRIQNGIEIIRVLHGARDLPNIFRTEESE